MTGEVYLPQGDPNEAVYFDRDARYIMLASGDRVPIVQYVDGDGEEIEDGDVDLHDSVGVVCGPLSNGFMLACTISVRDRRPSPAGGQDSGEAWQVNAVH